jgi:hypothetical protein
LGFPVSQWLQQELHMLRTLGMSCCGGFDDMAVVRLCLLSDLTSLDISRHFSNANSFSLWCIRWLRGMQLDGNPHFLNGTRGCTRLA